MILLCPPLILYLPSIFPGQTFEWCFISITVIQEHSIPEYYPLLCDHTVYAIKFVYVISVALLILLVEQEDS